MGCADIEGDVVLLIPSSLRSVHICVACSQHELMQQLEHTSTELNSSMDRLRQAEAERLTAWRELEHLRQQAAASVAEKQAMNVTIAQL